MTYRVFGSPFALTTHQAHVYLSQKGVPFQLHVSSLWGTRVASWWHGCASTFGNLNPEGKTLFTIQDLIKDCEENGPKESRSLLVPAATHPKLKVVCGAFEVYSMWWLMNCGGMFRWTHGEGSDMIKSHASYFLITGMPVSSTLAKAVRLKMTETLGHYGINKDTEDYMLHHVFRFIDALEAHFKRHQFLLGTPFATIADVLLCAVFDCHFLQDDPPATDVREGAEEIMAWTKRVNKTGDYGEDGVKRVDLKKESAEQVARVGESQNSDYPDRVPETLTPLLGLMCEVLPWLVAQCDAAKLWAKNSSNSNLEVLPIPGAAVYGTATEGEAAKQAGGRVVEGRKVPRLLDQPWEIALESATVRCQVSIPHVQMADVVAKGIVPMRWSPLSSSSTMEKPESKDGVTPATTDDDDEGTEFVEVQGGEGGVTYRYNPTDVNSCLDALHGLLVRMELPAGTSIHQLPDRNGDTFYGVVDVGAGKM